jgi:ribosomal protein L7/L12
MNQIMFQTYVAVPRDVIMEIGQGIRRFVVTEMVHQKNTYDSYKEDDIKDIGLLIDGAVAAYADAGSKSFDGWNLGKEEAREVASKIRQGLKIMAIKEFRTHTGAGLKEAKEVIDNFTCDEQGALRFLAAFMS